MDRLPANRSDWPTKGYVHGAIDILERIHYAKGHVSAIPMDCRPASWRFPQLVYALLNWWTEDEECRIAFLGFPQSPATILLGWMLDRARMGRRKLTGLEVQENEFAGITRACGFLATQGIVVQSAGFAKAGSFYAQVQRIAAEFGVNRVLAHDCLLRNGERLSQSPIPPGWQDICDFLDVAVVMVGRHDAGVRQQRGGVEACGR